MFNTERSYAAKRYRKLDNAGKARYQVLKSIMCELLHKPLFVDIKYCTDLPKLIEAVEYQMQEVLGFNKDSKFHSYWNKLDGCTCPKMDNDELFGTGERIISEDCPFHGKKGETKCH